MDNGFHWIFNEQARNLAVKTPTEFLSTAETKKVRDFHKSFDGYTPTPLRNLRNLSASLGAGAIFVKDESYRFGLNAFKALGGSYAIGKYLAGILGVPIEDITFNMLKRPHVKEKLGEITFATATDGNHGRGVAWAAQQLGQKAVVYMPKGSSLTRLNNIKATGADAYITDLNYDDTVRLSAENARKNGWVIVQDTCWPGYEDIPTWILQGYATMASEALEQLNQEGFEKTLTHIYSGWSWLTSGCCPGFVYLPVSGPAACCDSSRTQQCRMYPQISPGS